MDIFQELATTELFKDVPKEFLETVVSQNAPFELKKGELLLSPDVDNNFVYVLLSGRLALHFESLDMPEIRTIEPGVTVGEMSIIDHSKPSAFVLAKESCKVFPVHRELLLSLIAEANPVVRNLLKVLTRWIKSNTESMVNHTSQIGELTNHATTDALTGLYNRRWLDNALASILNESLEKKQTLCLLLIDVDHFKDYNDNLGHSVGDQVLIAIGNALKKAIRPQDYASRYGGEEFLIVLPNTSVDVGVQVAERIRQDIAAKSALEREGKLLPGITISIGLAVNQQDSSIQSLIDAADAKLYQAKQSGRNCVKH
jgi:diguanylate cyclase (GGDEF)-like protein